MKSLTLTGAPEERGRAYGAALREEIAGQIQVLRALIRDQAHLDPDAFFDHVLTLGWHDAAATWTPDLLAEVRGLAAGAGLPYADLFAWQCVQEILRDRRSYRSSTWMVNGATRASICAIAASLRGPYCKAPAFSIACRTFLNPGIGTV
jgi:hypothetical protein